MVASFVCTSSDSAKHPRVVRSYNLISLHFFYFGKAHVLILMINKSRHFPPPDVSDGENN